MAVVHSRPMMRGLMLLLLALAVLGIVGSLMRRHRGKPKAELKAVAPPAAHTRPALLAADELAFPQEEIFRRFHELAFGVLFEVKASGHEAVVAQANAALDSVATDPRYAPRRPMLLPQLMQAANDDETSREDLTKIIVRDPALAGSLLKLANTPLYRVGTQPVESIDKAVSLLGSEGIRSLAAAALVQPVFRTTGGRFKQFPDMIWEHTLRVGAAAEVHAAIVEDEDPFAAQLLGLLAGLGSIIVFRIVLDTYKAHPELMPDAVTIGEIMHARTPDVARRVAESWGLSERMLAALGDQAADPRGDNTTGLGRSLLFGRVVAALVMLHAHERINELHAKASMTGYGATGEQVKRVWLRLSAAKV